MYVWSLPAGPWCANLYRAYLVLHDMTGRVTDNAFEKQSQGYVMRRTKKATSLVNFGNPAWWQISILSSASGNAPSEA